MIIFPVSKIKTGWKHRGGILPVLFPRGLPPWRPIDLRIRWQVARLTARSNRTRTYQPIPFPEFADVAPRRDRACEERWRAIRSALPADLNNLSFLDLGAGEGYFSFQCVKDGASALALEWDYHKARLMNLLKQRYKLDRFDAKQTDLSTTSLRTLGEFDYAFYLNIHQHIYKRDPEVADRILREIGEICTKGIFVEARPVEFGPAAQALNPENPQPFRRVEDLVEAVKTGTGFTNGNELIYEGFDSEPENRQSVPEDSDNQYRLFFLTVAEADQFKTGRSAP
jgi:hypothetical protein